MDRYDRDRALDVVASDLASSGATTRAFFDGLLEVASALVPAEDEVTAVAVIDAAAPAVVLASLRGGRV